MSPLHLNPSTAYTVSQCQEPRQPALLHERVALCLLKLQCPIQIDLIVQRHRSKSKRISEQGTTLDSSIHCFSLTQPSTSAPPTPRLQPEMRLGCCAQQSAAEPRSGAPHQEQAASIIESLRRHSPTLFLGSNAIPTANEGFPTRQDPTPSEESLLSI